MGLTATSDPKSVAQAYFKAIDDGREDLFDFFADDAYVFFPKHPYAKGVTEIRQLFSDIAPLWKIIEHRIAYFNYIVEGGMVAVEGTQHGELSDAVGGGEWTEGRYCSVFEIREGKIQRLHNYTDPDFAGKDNRRYPWLTSGDK